MSSTQLDVADVSYIIFICLTFAFKLPFSIYCVHTLRQDWNATHIAKRCRAGVAFNIATTLYWIFVVVPVLGLLSIVVKNHGHSGGVHRYFEIVASILFCIGIIMLSVLIFVYLIRAWMLYYNTQLHNVELNDNWRMAIDPINYNKTNNWFVKHSKTLGSEKYLFRYAAILGIICGSFIFAAYAVIYHESLHGTQDLATISPNVALADGLICVIALIWVLAAVYLIFKLKYNTSDDPLGIRSELIILARVVPWAVVLYILPTIIGTFLTPEDRISLIIFRCYVLGGSMVVNLYLTALYPRRYVKRRSVVTTRSNYGDRADNDDHAWNQNVSYQDIIAEHDGFQAFMRHLQHEFSVENLLFIQEVKSCVNHCLCVSDH